MILSEPIPHQVRVLTGGEALPQRLAKQLQRLGPVINLYGPTEATIWASTQTVRSQDLYEGAVAVAIGTPMPGYDMYVLDERLELVPEGVVGEIYIAGPALARGYLGRAGLTSERFIACEFGGPGQRMYRTGDLARRRSDGAIIYLSRADDQVKIHGHRIELGEIDSAILECPGIHQSVTVTYQSTSSGTQLVSYVVLDQNHQSDPINQLRAQLSLSLPSYMVPAAFMVLEQLPLTPNGKLNRRALPEINLSASQEVYRAPENSQQAVVCRLYSELTGVDLVGIDDSFFAIGGHSLLAMRLVARLRQEFGVQLPVRILFENPTPLALAPHLDSTKLASYSPLLPFRKTGSRLPLFCVHPAGGGGSVYKNLADALGKDQPVWALQARGLEEGETFHENLDEMVTDYIAAIREVQAHGPYHLLGTSLGGLIAHEMTCRLEQQGETVAALILLDTATVQHSPGNASDSPEQRQQALLLSIGQDFGVTAESATLDNEALMTSVRDHMVRVGMIPAGTPLDDFKRLLEQSIRSSTLTVGRVKTSCQAPILLFKAMLDSSPGDKTQFDWSRHTKAKVSQIEVQAKHSDMLWQPGSFPFIAACINRYFSQSL